MRDEMREISKASYNLGKVFLISYIVLALIAGCCEVLSWKKELKKEEIKKNNAIESTDVEIA